MQRPHVGVPLELRRSRSADASFSGQVVQWLLSGARTGKWNPKSNSNPRPNPNPSPPVTHREVEGAPEDKVDDQRAVRRHVAHGGVAAGAELARDVAGGDADERIGEPHGDHRTDEPEEHDFHLYARVHACMHACEHMRVHARMHMHHPEEHGARTFCSQPKAEKVKMHLRPSLITCFPSAEPMS